jgi:hypothetical protein
MPMHTYQVSVRTYAGDTSRLRVVDVIANKPMQACISALTALNVQDPRFSVTVKPLEART